MSSEPGPTSSTRFRSEEGGEGRPPPADSTGNRSRWQSGAPSLSLAMSELQELGPLPPITVDVDLFEYVPLDSPRQPPAVELRACLARIYSADEDDEVSAEGLRLAFVFGRPIDSHDLLAIAYLWRPPPKGVAWGVERWSSPERRLRPYRHDPTFVPRAAADIHEELRRLGADSVAEYARDLLSR